jgi:tRNA (cytidine32/guanosine34-2'-O)-methyltransferase
VLPSLGLKSGLTQAKMFRGKDISLLYSQLRILFPEVSVVKPWSSRNSSIEAFVVCRNYSPPADFEAAAPVLLRMLSFKPATPTVDCVEGSLGCGADTGKLCGGALPFLACGSLQWDSDMTYDLETIEEGSGKAAERLQPVQPPLAPHYKEALEKINRWRF